MALNHVLDVSRTVDLVLDAREFAAGMDPRPMLKVSTERRSARANLTTALRICESA